MRAVAGDAPEQSAENVRASDDAALLGPQQHHITIDDIVVTAHTISSQSTDDPAQRHRRIADDDGPMTMVRHHGTRTMGEHITDQSVNVECEMGLI